MDKIEKKKKIESEKIPTQNTRPRAEAAQTARRQCGIHVEERVASACVAWKRHRGCNATVCGQAVTGPSGPSDMSGSARQGAAELRRQDAADARHTPATVWRNSTAVPPPHAEFASARVCVQLSPHTPQQPHTHQHVVGGGYPYVCGVAAAAACAVGSECRQRVQPAAAVGRGRSSRCAAGCGAGSSASDDRCARGGTGSAAVAQPGGCLSHRCGCWREAPPGCGCCCYCRRRQA